MPHQALLSATPRRSAPIHGRSTSVALIVPGLNGSCENHWQSVWEKERDDCRRAELGSWDDPHPDDWIARLDEEIRDEIEPVVLVAHSLGCIAAAMWARAYPRACKERIKAMLLVAPCDTEVSANPLLRRFAPLPQQRLNVRSMMVVSTDDHFATLDRSKHMARLWGSEFVNIGQIGHINARSNLGAWSYGQTLLNILKETPPDFPIPSAVKATDVW